MINPLALKVGLGGAVVTGAGTTGIIYKNEIKDFFERQFSDKKNTDSKENQEDSASLNDDSQTNKESIPSSPASTSQSPAVTPTAQPQIAIVSKNTFIIVKTKTSSNETFSNDLYSTDSTNSRNFKCVVAGASEDDNACDIYLISEKSDDKLNNLSDIKTFNTKATKQNITDNTLFKLTIKDSLLSEITWDGTQTVDIVSKTENKNSGSEKKKYGTFTLQYKVVNTTDNVSIEGKTNWIIGKINESITTNTISDISNLTCSISGETPSVASACSIFKIDTTETDIKNIATENVKDATTTTTDYVKDKYFVIDLKRTDKKNISDFTGKTITVNVTSGSIKIADFSFVTALVDDDVFKTTSKTIILS